MKLADLNIATAILAKYTEGASLEYVANSFPNGTPNNPSTLYIKVEVPWDAHVAEPDAEVLKSLGWVPEDEGDVWVFYQ